MNRIHAQLCFVVSFVLMWSCKDPVIIHTDRGEGYFPLESGRVLEYRVDSIIFDDAGASNRLDTFTAFIRETVTEEFVDLSGKTAFRIQRQHRGSTDHPWQTTHVWTAARDRSVATRVEENQRLVKMEFPLSAGKRWDPTRFIDHPNLEVPVGTELINMYSYWDGRVLSLHEPEPIGGFAFDSVMTCYQAHDDNELERRFVLEKYAHGVGLIFRMDTIVDSRCKRLGDFAPCFGMNWMQKGEKGYILRQELINHN